MIVLWVSVLISLYTEAQDSIYFQIQKKFGFENLNGDTISNTKFIYPFIQKLVAQKKYNNQKINILHIGDSHLQADYITHTTRVSLQQNFGNAGRGFITPLKISKSNEPFNYQTSSNNKWKSTRCVSNNFQSEIGLGGMSIKTYDTSATIKIKTYNIDSMNYSFKRIILYYPKSDSSFSASVLYNDSNYIFSNISPELPYRSTFESKNNLSNINIAITKTNNKQSQFTFFGTLLENGENGVLYHSIGINGAKYKDYYKTNEFTKQTSSLTPDIIIISLGTNEAFQKKYNSEIFYKEIDTLVTKLKNINPNTPILLTTPADSYYYHTTNHNIPLIRNTIIEYANNNNLAYWDLYSITGGLNSAINWKKNNLLSKDGIHYTKDGYIHQGNLLTLSIINAYNKYVSTR